MTWNTIDTVPKPEYPEEFMVYNQKEIPVLFALPDGRVKEGFCKWKEDFSADEFKCNLRYYLANDSCDCCYGHLGDSNIPTHWAEMPQYPTKD